MQDQPISMATANEHGRPPRLLPRSDAAAAYRLVYERVDALLRGRAEIAELTVPACPDWTVRQTLAHLAGVAQDVAALNLEGITTESWTQAQVDRLGRHSIDDLLDLWREAVEPVAARLTQGASESSAGQMVFDALTHEHDIRGALGEPGPRAGDLPFVVALGFMTTTFDNLSRETGLPVFRLTTPTLRTVQMGNPETATTHVALDVADFEALRAFGGRRSLRQLRTLPWDGDPAEVLAALGNDAIRPPGYDLVE